MNTPKHDTRWIVATMALAIAFLLGFAHATKHPQRLDVNGEPLEYNAPCSTDTDCAARIGP